MQVPVQGGDCLVRPKVQAADTKSPPQNLLLHRSLSCGCMFERSEIPELVVVKSLQVREMLLYDLGSNMQYFFSDCRLLREELGIFFKVLGWDASFVSP